MQKIIVIGGGVVGLCSAYYLNQEGFDVTVVDRHDITDGCSFGNMGYISPSHFVPLPTPGIIQQGLKWMLSSSSPFYIKPRLSADLIRWGWHFWKHCNERSIQKNAPHMVNLLQLSRQTINDIRDTIGNGFEMQEIGCLMLCKSPKTLEHEYHLADDGIKFGLQVEKLNAAEVQALEPEVELDVAGAVLFKDDAHFHPGTFMQLLKDYLIQRGVKFLLNTTVTGFEKHNGGIKSAITVNGSLEADHWVISAGSWLPKLAAMVHQKLLLQPGKGYSYTYPNIEKNIQYPAILVDGRCAITPWSKKLRIGGTMELSGYNSKVLLPRMEGIYKSIKSFYPGLEIEFPPTDKIWSGLRPVTPDGMPYIGRHSNLNNLVFAGGHAMLGLSMASGTGKLVSEILANKKCSIDIAAYTVDRF